MAVSAGTYVTEARLQGYLAGWLLGTAFSTTSSPLDTEVSRFIVEVEARVEAHLSAAGFTVAITGGDAVIYVQTLCSSIVAGRCLEAATDSRSSQGGADTTALRLQAQGWSMLWAVIGDPSDPLITGNADILTEAGLTSAHSATKLFASWETENSSITYATTPTYNHDTEF